MRALVLVLFCCLPAAADDAPDLSQNQHRRSLGLGVNYLGGQVDYDFGKGKRVELLVQQGQESSSEGRIRSTTVGLRAMQRYRIAGVYHPYIGAQAAYVDAKVAGGAYKVTGGALGPLIGVERSLSSRLSAGLDAGPCLFVLNERNTRTGGAQFDVVLNAFLLLRAY